MLPLQEMNLNLTGDFTSLFTGDLECGYLWYTFRPLTDTEARYPLHYNSCLLLAGMLCIDKGDQVDFFFYSKR